MTRNSSNRKSTVEVSDDYDLLITDKDELALKEASNGLLQFDEMLRIAEDACAARSIQITPRLLLRLNYFAIQGIRRSAGTFRKVAIGIENTNHQPPPPETIEPLVGEMCEYANKCWTGRSALDAALHVSAYLMWRLNWIHPFRDGNGRTSRALSYLALTVGIGRLLPGSPAIPDQIVDNRGPYYAALDAADAAWARGVLDVSVMEALIVRLLENQLSSDNA